MNRIIIQLLTVICVFLMANGMYAEDICEPSYPDQFQFEPCTGDWELYASCGSWYGQWTKTVYINGEKWVFDWVCGPSNECDSQPLVYNKNDISCSNGNYPCRYTWAQCHDPGNPNNLAVARYRKYKRACP